MAGRSEAAIQGTLTYHATIRRIMSERGLSCADAKRHYREHMYEYRTEKSKTRKRRSSDAVLIQRILATKNFVRQCGGMQKALDALKLYKEIS